MDAQQIIEDAYSKIRVKTAGYDLSNEEAQLALRELNRMLRHWATKNLLIPYRTTETLTMVSGTYEYTIGTSGDFNTTRPISIHEISVRQNNIDYPCYQVDYKRFSWNSNKADTGRPDNFTYEPEDPLGRLFFNPAPDSAYTLLMRSLKPLGDFSTLVAEDTFPPEYEDVVVYNLAVRMAPDFGKEASPTTQRMAQMGLRELMNQNAAFRVPSLTVDPALRRRYRYHIQGTDF